MYLDLLSPGFSDDDCSPLDAPDFVIDGAEADDLGPWPRLIPAR